MKNIVLALLISLGGITCYSQEFKYSFKVVDATTNEASKSTINQLRDLLGVQVVRFFNPTDLFVIETHHDFIVDEMVYKLALNDVLVNGAILKENLE